MPCGEGTGGTHGPGPRLIPATVIILPYYHDRVNHLITAHSVIMTVIVHGGVATTVTLQLALRVSHKVTPGTSCPRLTCSFGARWRAG